MTHTEIVTILNPAGVEPHPSRYTHTDVDGDRLLISTADINGEPGLYFRTDSNGSSVPLGDMPALLAKIPVISAAAIEETGGKPADPEPDLRATLATLVSRWREMAESSDQRAVKFANGTLSELCTDRAHRLRRAAEDIETVLRTGLVPHDLMTDAELERHGPT